MKFTKYLAMVLCAGALLTSCGEKVVEDVGQTTVEFEKATYESGFGAGMLYVPIVIKGDNKEAMNTTDVNLKIKVDSEYTNGSRYIGKEDEDFIITSYDLKFINNYEIPEDKKDEPFKKTIGVEIRIINTDLFSMDFKLVIENCNTTLGTNSECVVKIEKTVTDAICGTYNVTATVPSPFDDELAPSFKTQIGWSNQYECFEILPFEDWNYTPVYAYWDAENTQMWMQPYEPLLWYDSAAMQMCYQVFFAVEGGNISLVKDPILLECDLDNQIIKFPDDLYFGILVFSCDEAMNPTGLIGRFTSACGGWVFNPAK